jgi:curved DNA-binding protein CbpA
MSRFDPYEVLGVVRSSSATVLKAAYRQKVQASHPDRGGDPELFIQVVRAFDLLSDPEARRLYDETGTIDDDGVRRFRRAVIDILADMFDAAVETAVATGLDLGGVDFVQQMSNAVETGLAEARGSLRRSERDVAALAALQRRIRRRDGGDNVFALRLGSQLERKREAEATLRRRQLILETALVELGNYRNEVELIAALEAEG